MGVRGDLSPARCYLGHFCDSHGPGEAAASSLLTRAYGSLSCARLHCKHKSIEGVVCFHSRSFLPNLPDALLVLRG